MTMFRPGTSPPPVKIPILFLMVIDMFSSVFQCNDRSKDPVKFEATPYSNTGKNWIDGPSNSWTPGGRALISDGSNYMTAVSSHRRKCRMGFSPIGCCTRDGISQPKPSVLLSARQKGKVRTQRNPAHIALCR